MTPQRWQRIEQLYDAALERNEGERAAYLDEACGGDNSLRQEVVSLLSVYERPGSFMDAPPHQVWAQLIAADRAGLQQDDSSNVLTARGRRITGDDDYDAKEKKLRITRRLRLALFGLFFTLMSICLAANSYTFNAYFTTSSDPGWYVGLDGRIQTIRGISNADVSALQDGDEIVDLDGQQLKNSGEYLKFFQHASPGSPYTVLIRRGGQPQRVALRTAARQLWMPISLNLFWLVFPAIFLLTGLGVFLLKPYDKQAALLSLMLGMFRASFPPFSISMADLPSWLVWLLIAAYLVGAGLFPVILHFFLIFPERSPLLRRYPRLELYQYLLFLLTAYPFAVIVAFVLVTAPDRGFLDVCKDFFFLFVVSLITSAMYLLGALLSLAFSYRRANQLLRRKLRVVLVGSIIGLLPALSLSVVLIILKPPITPLMFVIGMPAFLMLLLVPLSFAYAIARHRVIPVSLIIRRGVQHLLAKNALRIILILLIIGLLVSMFANPNRTLLDVLFHSSIYFYLLLIGSIAFSLTVRRRLSEWIDRKFFREAYDQEKILRELIDDIKPLDSPLEISKHVGAQVERALHPDHMYLFNQEEDKRDLLLSYSSSEMKSPRLRIPAEFRLLRFMENEPCAVEFPFQRSNNLPFVERAWLAGLGTNLIVPMSSTKGRLTGLFLLGEKKSEVPYTATDRRLLEAVANQIALIYENLLLKKHVASERKIKSEVLARIDNQGINLLRECPKCGECFDSAEQLCVKDQTELSLSLPVERKIDERYRLDQLIGKGGMGAVYEAMDIRLQRKVAVKILIGSLFGDSEALRRFEREAQTAARLNHPNIIAVYDYGVLATQGAYLVMDLARGATLGTIMKREYKLDPKWAAEIFDQILDGVGAAHQAGVIHRDLKPDNILITVGEKGRPLAKVLDFGLAKLARSKHTDLSGAIATTSPGTIMGTFGYMAPEQLTGTRADERSDLFAVGVMMVEALTGQRPFTGKTHHELLTAMQRGTFSLPDDRRLHDVLRRCLASDPAGRYASAAEMQRELIPVLRAYRSGARSGEPLHGTR